MLNAFVRNLSYDNAYYTLKIYQKLNLLKKKFNFIFYTVIFIKEKFLWKILRKDINNLNVYKLEHYIKTVMAN